MDGMGHGKKVMVNSQLEHDNQACDRFFRNAFQFHDPEQNRIAFHISFHLSSLDRRSDPIQFPIRSYAQEKKMRQWFVCLISDLNIDLRHWIKTGLADQYSDHSGKF
jgi:hypothetical protein